jgi:hypothetical protein
MFTNGDGAPTCQLCTIANYDVWRHIAGACYRSTEQALGNTVFIVAAVSVLLVSGIGVRSLQKLTSLEEAGRVAGIIRTKLIQICEAPASLRTVKSRQFEMLSSLFVTILVVRDLHTFVMIRNVYTCVQSGKPGDCNLFVLWPVLFYVYFRQGDAGDFSMLV